MVGCVLRVGQKKSKQPATKGIDVLFSMEFWTSFGEAAKTSAGFFWKSGWAFVLGYFISAIAIPFKP